MLLSVDKLNSRKHGTILDVWYVGGEQRYVERPFDPYFYSMIKMPKFTNEELMLTDLATFKKVKMFKVGFPTTTALKKYASAFTTEDTVPYVQRVVIDEGFDYPSEKPSHHAFDIEFFGGKITAVSFYGEKDKDVSAGSNERDNITFLNRKIRDTNTDVVDTYWGSYFDVLKLQERAKHHGLKLVWGRNLSTPYIRKRRYRRGPKIGVEQTVKIEGRLHFDVWREVDLDQTLHGIKDHRLKTVARWFNLPPPIIEPDYEEMQKLSTDELAEYCLNDSRLTWLLAEMYLNRLYYFADSLKIPLNLLLERTPSHLPNYITMRDMKRLGFIAKAGNNERFPQFFTHGRKAYQGAWIKLLRAGIFGKLKKADFKSMYPSIMGCLNLSPEKVELLSVEHMVCTGMEKPVFKDDQIWIYDDKVGLFKVRIREGDGVCRQRIRTWMGERNKVKKMLKENQKDPALESWQYGLKVNLNKIYGYHGMRYARYGVAPIAAVVTGIGRWWMIETVKYIGDEGGIEVDTDGEYYEGANVGKELTEHIRSMIPEPYDTNFIKVVDEVFDAGIFYEEKSYILKDGDRLLFHGSGLKGRHLPAICDRASEELTNGIFEGRDVKSVIWKYTKLKDYPLKDFVMTVELHKEKYKDDSMYGQLINLGKKYGIDYQWGSEVRYVKCKIGYVPYEVMQMHPNRYKLDYDYYRGRLTAVLSRILGPTKKMRKKTIEMILKKGQMVL